MIIEEGDILAGNNSTLAHSCVSTSERTCVDNIIDISRGLITNDCTVTSANASFIAALDGTDDILYAISDFACEKDCYIALKNCQRDKRLCGEGSLSCDCIINFLSIIDNLSPSSRSGLLKMNDTTIQQMQEMVLQCECDALSDEAAMLKNESHCSLYESIIREGSIFAGSVKDVQSTCAQRLACVGNVTEVAAKIRKTSGCDIQQKTDDLEQFIFALDNNHTDFEKMTSFICKREDCYKDMRAAVVACRGPDSIESCGNSSITRDCFDALNNMASNLTVNVEDDFIGVNLTILESIIEEMRKENSAATSSSELASMHVILLCIACMIFSTSCAISPHTMREMRRKTE